jgi:hypothetical protein
MLVANWVIAQDNAQTHPCTYLLGGDDPPRFSRSSRPRQCWISTHDNLGNDHGEFTPHVSKENEMNNMTKHSTTESNSNWLEHFKQQGYYSRQAVIFTLCCGLYLHLTRLFLGDDLLLRHVFTPLFDKWLAVPMTYAAITGLLCFRRAEFTSKPQKLAHIWALFYVTASIPLHIAVYFTNSTEYIRFFPYWFSVLLLPMYSGIIWLEYRLRLRDCRASGN